MSATITPGSTFAGYRVEELIGHGGMGVVYRATDVKLQRPGGPQADRARAGRGRALPQALPRSESPLRGLARPRERRSDLRGGRAGRAALPGDALRRGQRSQGAARARRPVGARADAGARSARSRARSTPPTGAGSSTATSSRRTSWSTTTTTRYLTDFGISEAARRRHDRDRRAASGSLDYLAPEQIGGEPVDGAHGPYALACVLYECLTGAPPFRRETRGRDAVGAHAGGAAAAARPSGARPGAAAGRWRRIATSASPTAAS